MKILTEIDGNVLVMASKAELSDIMDAAGLIYKTFAILEPIQPMETHHVAPAPVAKTAPTGRVCAKCGCPIPDRAGKKYCEACAKVRMREQQDAWHAKHDGRRSAKPVAPDAPAQKCASCGVAVPAKRKYCEKCAKAADAESKRQSYLRRKNQTPALAAPVVQTATKGALQVTKAKACNLCSEPFAGPGNYCGDCMANRRNEVMKHMMSKKS